MLAGGGDSPTPPAYWGIYFEAEEDNVVVSASIVSSRATVIYKSTDGINWTEFVYDRNFTKRVKPETLASKGDRVYLRAASEYYGNNTTLSSIQFQLTGKVRAAGNIMSLFNATDEENVTLPTSECCSGLFAGCSSLTSAPELPATTLTTSCYYNMFKNCSSLAEAPALPSTTLANSCYSQMFYNCTSLASAPELPATTLINYCYNNMFWGCSSLTSAPILPATTLVSYCYSGMFNTCSNLSTIEVGFTDWNASGWSTNGWTDGVAANGTFTCPAALGTDSTITRGISNCPSGWTVVNI